jgi:hypothetical protein
MNITIIVVTFGLSIPFLWVATDILVKVWLHTYGVPTVTTVIRNFIKDHNELACTLFFVYGMLLGWLIGHLVGNF